MGRLRQPVHPLLASPLATRMTCYLDLMHMVDCKGVASWVFGGVLHYLLRDERLGSSQKTRLQRLNEERLRWYSGHTSLIRLPRLLLHSCQRDGWAELNGPAYKAAVTRHAAGFFDHLARTFCTSSAARDANLRKVTSALLGFYQVLYTAGWFLTDEELTTLREHTEAFGVAYQRLRNLAASEGVLAWPVRPKAHNMQHAPELAGHLNPVKVQTYAEESSMGTTAKVYKKSMSGRYRGKVQVVVLCKRLTALWLRLEGATS